MKATSGEGAAIRYFELQGAETTNKGAHLMALTVIDRFQRLSTRVEACVYPRAAPRELVANPLRVLWVFPPEPARSRRGRMKAGLRDALMRRLLAPSDLRRYGLVERHKLSGLVDISGYAYGDAWPHAARRVELAESYRKKRQPVVLLPQMFGPFETSRSRSELERLFEASSLLCARDAVSFAEVEAVVGKSDKLALAPDITIGFGSASPLGPAERHGAILIPNEKVLIKKQSEWGASYRRRLLAAIEKLQVLGEEVTLLVHESGGGDAELARGLAEEAGGAVRVRTSDDPLELKHVLGRARLVIGSRYHSLVSALSMGTPAIALGWAHKYETLQADFGVPELQHRGKDAPDHLGALVDRLLDSEIWTRTHETLCARKVELVARLDALWPRVMQTLGV